MLSILQNILLFIVLVLSQVLVLNNIQFLGFINPYIYILFILSLPAKLPRWFVLVLGFCLGFVIDIFSNTLGIHIFATVLVAYLRSFVIQLFTSIDEGNNPIPSFHSFGVGAYIKYVVALVVLHHTALFFIEAFSFSHLGLIPLKILMSSSITILLILGLKSMHRK
ncbi:MAG: rod shape-determining protein MreD [Porphyromonadaceae bacterium CG2_30_38_12]|nr:MAG: rod shape-determining protein MreD [Porphyromonadaceae bacterium CG2_30_38_12]